MEQSHLKTKNVQPLPLPLLLLQKVCTFKMVQKNEKDLSCLTRLFAVKACDSAVQ